MVPRGEQSQLNLLIMLKANKHRRILISSLYLQVLRNLRQHHQPHRLPTRTQNMVHLSRLNHLIQITESLLNTAICCAQHLPLLNYVISHWFELLFLANIQD